ncbi:MAG: hypothetical protein HYY78_22995 [Betaproteobacteria bacterium]|nr:hypothetical protein [Betaproteobacteria bacterium]
MSRKFWSSRIVIPAVAGIQDSLLDAGFHRQDDVGHETDLQDNMLADRRRL